jgi:hypothetical protein
MIKSFLGLPQAAALQAGRQEGNQGRCEYGQLAGHAGIFMAQASRCILSLHKAAAIQAGAVGFSGEGDIIVRPAGCQPIKSTVCCGGCL